MRWVAVGVRRVASGGWVVEGGVGAHAGKRGAEGRGGGKWEEGGGRWRGAARPHGRGGHALFSPPHTQCTLGQDTLGKYGQHGKYSV